MRTSDLVRFAGGLKRSAFEDIADVTTYDIADEQKVVPHHQEINLRKALAGDEDQDVLLKPGDVIGIRQITGWSDIGSTITVRGEVRYPGTYGIGIGERLSTVLERAGGFTSDAYPYGASLERIEVKELAEQSKVALIRKLRSEALTPPRSSDDKNAGGDLEAENLRKQMIADLISEPASGRLSIDITSDIAHWKGTPADVIVQPGDQITIPKNLGFVRINGQVYTPTAISYLPHKTAGWYLRNAGGLTNQADKKGIFIVRANGRVVSGLSRGRFSGNSVMSTVLYPGDSIVVPQKVNTNNPIWKNLAESAQIMSALAITAAAAGI
jgi:protein involved in polysaccharide export with SLBB domain